MATVRRLIGTARRSGKLTQNRRAIALAIPLRAGLRLQQPQEPRTLAIARLKYPPRGLRKIVVMFEPPTHTAIAGE